MTGGNEQKPNGTGPPTASLSVGSTAVVVMGPSGCGKSTLASALAETLGWTFIEGDDHHPPENVEKMAGGEPLTDEDRLPFLKSVGRELHARSPAVASCSALTSAHRTILRSFNKDILFVWPKVSRPTLKRRMEEREGHFMRPALLESQLSFFDPPYDEGDTLCIDGEMPTSKQIDAVLHGFADSDR